MVFIATFNIISPIPWWSVLLVDETPKKKHRSAASHRQILSPNVVIEYASPERGSTSQC